MNELLDAAKAVIDLFDDNFSISDCEHVDNLRAAVERAEKQEVVGFDEWWEENYKNYCVFPERNIGKRAWTAAQQAEREQIKTIIRQFSPECSEDGEWVRCCDELLEKIDATTE